MRVLFIVHGLPPAESGGTQIYTDDLSSALAMAAGDQVFVLTRDADSQRPELSVRREHRNSVTILAVNNTFQACTSFEDSYTNPSLLRVAAALIDEIRPDVAHVQHLTCLSIGLLENLSRRGIPIVFTLNDYWLICHRGQLLDLDGRQCGGPYDVGCARCLSPGLLAGPTSYRLGHLARSLPIPGASAAVGVLMRTVDAATPAGRTREASQIRLDHMRDAARHVDLFLAPSETMIDRFTRFGIPRGRLARCDQGINLSKFHGIHRERSLPGVLRLGFAGALIPSKAPHLLLEAAATLPPGSVTVDLLGATAPYHGDNRYARALAALLTLPFIRRLGPVPHERLPRCLAAIDVVVVPSVWIENAPFIIREAFAAGVPVVASNLGGMAEMVRHEVDGLLFAPGDRRALAMQLGRLQDERGLLDRLRGAVTRPVSIEDDARELRRTYVRLLSGKRSFSSAAVSRENGADGSFDETVTTRPASARDLAGVVLNYATPYQTLLAVRSLQTSFTVPDRIFIVDNGSPDASATILRTSLTGVELIETGKNLGFSGGCNAGIRAALAAGAEYVLLVNSDVVLAPESVGALMASARDDETAGVLAPMLVSREEPGRIASAGISYSRRSGRMRHLGAGQTIGMARLSMKKDLDAVSGCVMLVRRRVFERIGVFQDDYFFSFEDIDFCLAAGSEGFRIVCVPHAIAYHEGGRTIGRRSPRRVYFATRNHLRLASRGASAGAITRTLRGALIVGLNTAYVLRAPDAPLFPGLAAVARGLWHHVTGRYGPD